VAFPTAALSAESAARFLNQATFGATEADIAALRQRGLSAWFEQQTSLAPTRNLTQELAEIARRRASGSDPNNYGLRGTVWQINEVMWRAYVKSEDQLRQRMTHALIQIFVVNTLDHYETPRAAVSFMDMLGRNAFGNYRQLLEDVTLHPAMGISLSHLGNSKGDAATGRIPDQNYARELMQLFTIGLWELNQDGTQKLRNGQPIPTYGTADIIGASRVLTGFHWSTQPDDWSRQPQPDYYLSPEAMQNPMKAFLAYHETGEKRFLGVTIPASSVSNPRGDVDVLLDTVFNHPNTPPFVSKQLIQRFVTSNPSPAYVKRVADVFVDNGRGVRGDLKAVLQAILADPEARDAGMISRPDYGKIREPVLRFAHVQRLFDARDVDGDGYAANLWDDPLRGIGQQPLRSRTVFNDYRPDYAPPNSDLAQQGKVAPEAQIINETSIFGWQRNLRSFLEAGGFNGCCSEQQRRALTLDLQYEPFYSRARNPEQLVDLLDLVLMAGQMSAQLRADVLAEINAEDDRSSTQGLQYPLEHMRIARGVWAVMVSPEYLVQK